VQADNGEVLEIFCRPTI